jgi:PadR family transcriptional regulator, regulatory protein PadR
VVAAVSGFASDHYEHWSSAGVGARGARNIFPQPCVSYLDCQHRLVVKIGMRKAAPLSFGQVSVLHAIADGNRFGFDVIDATGLTSGSVYPTLDKLESLGYLTSRWEDAKIARRDKRPPRRYFDLTAQGATALAAALTRYKTLKPVSLAAFRNLKSEV